MKRLLYVFLLMLMMMSCGGGRRMVRDYGVGNGSMVMLYDTVLLQGGEYGLFRDERIPLDFGQWIPMYSRDAETGTVITEYMYIERSGGYEVVYVTILSDGKIRVRKRIMELGDEEW